MCVQYMFIYQCIMYTLFSFKRILKELEFINIEF